MDSCDGMYQLDSKRAVYLPGYVRVLREIERVIVERLTQMGAQEVFLPKIVSEEEAESLRQSHDGISEEWRTEQYRIVSPSGDFAGYLAHWQCEPFYHALGIIKAHWGESRPLLVYDRCGPSYRCEKEVGPMRTHEFWRLEVMLCGPLGGVTTARNAILQFVNDYALALGLDARVITAAGYACEDVKDVMIHSGSDEIEVCGSHVHHRLFEHSTEAALGPDEVTACIGISLNRLTFLRIHIDRGKSACITRMQTGQQ